MRLSKASAYAISAALLTSMSLTGKQIHAETIDHPSDSDQITSVNLSGISDDNVDNITTDVTIQIDPAMINQVIITGINDVDLNQQLDTLATNEVIASTKNNNSLPVTNDHINNTDVNTVNETNTNLATNSVTDTASAVNTNTVSADTNHVNNDAYLTSSDSISSKAVTSDKDDENVTNTHSAKSVTIKKSKLADNYADLQLKAPSNDPITKDTYIDDTFQTDIHRVLKIQQYIKSQPITVQKERPQHKVNKRSKTVQIPPVDYMINMIRRQLNWN